jgi:probable rRNA maturation factor
VIKTKKKNEMLQILKEVAPWKKVGKLDARLRKAAEAVIEALPENLQKAARKAEINVLLTSDAAVQRMNHDFRGKKKPTNVLSFPQYTKREIVKESKARGPLFVGDIALAYQYVAAEAKREDKILLDHVAHLVIHGVLHLFGYDHLTEASAKKMEKLERKIMLSLCLPDPYAAPVVKTGKKKKASKKTR